MFLDDLERRFVLHDMEVVNEFEVASFLANASSAVKGKFTAVELKSKLSHYSSTLTEAVANISNISLDAKEIGDFLAKWQTFARRNSYTVRDIGTTSKYGVIKPQYISQYTDIITKILDKTVNGEISQDEVDRYAGDEYVDTVKKQVVSAPSTNIKQLIATRSSTYSTLDPMYVKNQLIPFVSSFKKEKAALIAEATSLQHAIKESEEGFDAILRAIGKLKVQDGGIPVDTLKKLDYVSYHVLRGYIDILGYATYVMIAKLNEFGTNVLTAEKCYYDIMNVYSTDIEEGAESSFENDIFPTDESNLAEDLEAGKASAYSTIANNLYEYHSKNPLMGMSNGNLKSTGDILHSAFDMEIDFTGYSKEVYDRIIKMYLEIGIGLGKVASSCDDYIMIFDDIRKSAGFIISLEDRFRGVLAKIDDLTNYSADIPGITDNNVFRNALAEVKDFGSNMDRIASVICDTKVQMDYVQGLLDKNVNGEFKDAESLNELKIMMDRLREEFRTLNTIVAKKCMIRLRTLGEILASVTTKVEDPDASPDTIADIDLDHTDYRQESFIHEIENLEQIQKTEFMRLEDAYNAEKLQSFRGIFPIFEAETPGSTSPSTPGANNANTNNSTSTKPTVVDNSGQSAGSDAKGFFGNIVEKVRQFISVFLSNVSRSGAKNAQWVNENVQALSNRDYTNVTLNILPYKNLPYTTIIPNIQKMTQTVNGMSAQILQGIQKKDDAYSKLFSALPNSGISAEDKGISPSVQLENYFKTGKVAGDKVIAISNADLKSQVTGEMIPYCQKYASEFSEQLQKALTDLAKATDNLSTKIGDPNVAPNDTQNQNTAGNMQQSIKWIGEGVNDLSKGVLNAVRHRNNDYLRALSSLKPNEPVANVRATTNPEENQNQAVASAAANTAQAQSTEPTVAPVAQPA